MVDKSSPDLTIKQQREQRRAQKVAALKAKQAKEKRNRRLGIGGAILGGIAVIAVLVGVVVTSATPPPPTSQNLTAAERAALEIDGEQVFDPIESPHVETTVDYEVTPPVAGPHSSTWLNCGIYEQEVPAENVLHSLEHSAVWVTYNPDDVSGDDLSALRRLMPSSYTILSPYPDLDAPVVVSAWGVQVAADGVDDPRIVDFVVKHRLSPTSPEPGGPCTQGLDGPGKIS